MRKQIYNLNCRKQTSGVPGAAPLTGSEGQRPWRGPRGSAPGGVPGAAPLAGSRGSAPGGVQGQRPWRGSRGSAPGGGIREKSQKTLKCYHTSHSL